MARSEQAARSAHPFSARRHFLANSSHKVARSEQAAPSSRRFSARRHFLANSSHKVPRSEQIRLKVPRSEQAPARRHFLVNSSHKVARSEQGFRSSRPLCARCHFLANSSHEVPRSEQIPPLELPPQTDPIVSLLNEDAERSRMSRLTGGPPASGIEQRCLRMRARDIAQPHRPAHPMGRKGAKPIRRPSKA